LAIASLLILGVAVFVWLRSFRGDPRAEYLDFHNQTADTLIISVTGPGGNQLAEMSLPSGESSYFPVDCDALSFVAKTTNGRVLETRPASPDCGDEDWTIEGIL
jgi:hypothetical protein